MLSAYRAVLKKLFGRSGNEGERCAQFMAHVGEELQLGLSHALHLLGHSLLLAHRVVQLSVDARLGYVGTYGKGARHDE